MSLAPWCFPFGQPVRNVVQKDLTPKRVFVLGVYASAVHAKWVGKNSRPIVNALAVASEPYIFWRGDDADKIIQKIEIPEDLGKLLPANPQYNGPSGIALDELILKPLGLGRSDAWLCDLVPHSCVNPAQKVAIGRSYLKVSSVYGLPEPSVPALPSTLADETRRSEILCELQESNAEMLILLGDKPIEWFLRYSDNRWAKLSDFITSECEYSVLHESRIAGKKLHILPLAHPRQIGKLGQSSIKRSR